MMKRYLLLLIIITIPVFSNVQANNSINLNLQSAVTDPQNLVQNILNGGYLTKLVAAASTAAKAKKLAENVTKAMEWIKIMKSIDQFIFLIESSTCMLMNLDINMQICNSRGLMYDSCLTKFKYRVNINKLQRTLDLLDVVLINGDTDRMTRLLGLSQAMAAYESGQMQLKKISDELDDLIKTDDAVKFLQEEKEQYKIIIKNKGI